MYQKKKGKYGITLVSLVITVIVLLILAGVSLTMLTNENGIISKAQEAKEETRGATVEEAKDVWKLNKEVYESTSSSNVQTLEELLAELESKEQLTAEEVETIKETGEVTIGSRTIVFGIEKTRLIDAVNSGEIQIGDYVYFENPTSGSYTVLASKVGLEGKIYVDDTNQTQIYEITATKNQLNWRVLGVEDGKVKLIAGSPLKSNNTVGGEEAPYLYMYGAKAYTEGYKEPDYICEDLYGSLPLVNKARSVNLNDINQITGITTEAMIKEVNLDYYYGRKQYGDAYSFTDQYTPESWLDGKTTTTVSGTVNGYYYSINSAVEEGAPHATVTDARLFNMLFNNTEYSSTSHYWLSSRGVRAYSSNASFGPDMVYTDYRGCLSRFLPLVFLKWGGGSRLCGGAPRSTSEFGSHNRPSI